MSSYKAEKQVICYEGMENQMNDLLVTQRHC